MKPAALSLIAAGTAMGFGCAFAVSLTMPFETESVRGPGGNYSLIHRNIWGRSLSVESHFHFEDESTSPPTPMERWESGPYLDETREGRWVVKNKRQSDPTWTEATVWYLHGTEVSQAEYEKPSE